MAAHHKEGARKTVDASSKKAVWCGLVKHRDYVCTLVGASLKQKVPHSLSVAK